MATGHPRCGPRPPDHPSPGRRSRARAAARLTLLLAVACWADPLAAQGSPADESAIREAIATIQARKDASDWAGAFRIFEATLPRAPERGLVATELQFEAADIRRRQFAWQESMAWLDRAEQALPAEPSRERGRWAAMLAIGRGSVAIERGLPDLAHEQAQQAKAIADPDDRYLAERIAYLGLRIHRALDQRDAARALLADHEARFGIDHGLRIRAALAIMQDREAPATQLAEVDDWLATANAAVTTPDERALLGTVRVLRNLAKGDHGAAAAALAELQSPVPEQLGERPFAIQALHLRLAHESGAPAATVRARHAELARTWRRLLDEWRKQPVEGTGLGAMVPLERQRTLSELIKTHIALDGPAGPALALQLVLDVGQLGSTVRTAAAAPCTVDTAIQALTGQDRGSVLYVPGPDRTWVFVIAANALRVLELPARTLQIERLGRELIGAIHLARHGGADELAARERAEQALAAAVLPAAVAEAIRPWRAVTFVGQESLGYVPFELLRLPDRRRVGCAFAVSYLPSPNVGAWLRDRHVAAAPPARAQVALLACADVVPPPPAAMQPLPLTADDRTALLAPARAATIDVRTGTAVRRQDLVAAPGRVLLELIAHGQRDERRTDPQGILLGDGSTLWPRDIETLQLPPYAVFASCRAGRGRPRRGDDGRNLPSGAALLAGCRAVVAPWLEVEYRPTLALLRHLHAGLFSDGLPLDEALRQARVAVADELGDEQVDAFLFHATGLTEAPLAQPAKRSPEDGPAIWPWLAAGGMLVAGAFIAWRRRRR